jgi:hypothetical protein
MKSFSDYIEEDLGSLYKSTGFDRSTNTSDDLQGIKKGKHKFYPGAHGLTIRSQYRVSEILDDIKKNSSKGEAPENEVAKLRNMLKQADSLLRRVKTTRTVKESCCDSCQEELVIEQAEYQGRKVKLNDPFRSSDGKKKFYVYVKNEKGNVIKLGFGDPNMEIKRDDPGRRKNFRARHQCDTDPGPKWKARYWSCKMWEKGKTVSELD